MNPINPENPVNPENPAIGEMDKQGLPESPDSIMNMHTAAMREMEEPRDGLSPTPVAFLILCFFMTMWGGYYMGTYSGDWTGNGLSERRSEAGNAGPVAPQNAMLLGQEIYNGCLQCHQGNGMGLAGQFPPLADSEYVTGDVRRLAAILINGISGEMEVKGVLYNSQMPAWKDTYNDEEIAAVLTYVRNSFGNKADPVSKQQVEDIRKEVGAQGEWTAKSLAEYADKK